jgi:hypothetical protein
MADAIASKRKAAVSIGRRLVAVLLWFNEAIILACPIARKAKMTPLPPIIYDAKHWRRDRAEEARRKAESMRNRSPEMPCWRSPPATSAWQSVRQRGSPSTAQRECRNRGDGLAYPFQLRSRDRRAVNAGLATLGPQRSGRVAAATP